MPLPTPKLPTADGNPPEYNAMKDLAERCAKAEAELERVKIERDEALVARDFADAALERVQKQRDTMQDSLIRMQCSAGSDCVPRSELEASQKREAAYLNELRFWAGGKHNGDCEFIAPDEGCWKCEKAEQDRWPQTKSVLDQPDPGSDFVRRSELEASKKREATMRQEYDRLCGIACEFIAPDEDNQPECTCCHRQLGGYHKGHTSDCLANAILDPATQQAFKPDAGSDTL